MWNAVKQEKAINSSAILSSWAFYTLYAEHFSCTCTASARREWTSSTTSQERKTRSLRPLKTKIVFFSINMMSKMFIKHVCIPFIYLFVFINNINTVSVLRKQIITLTAKKHYFPTLNAIFSVSGFLYSIYKKCSYFVNFKDIDLK